MTIDLVVIGCGNVGTELLRQVAAQTERLAEYGIRVRLVAVANSRRMAVARGGFSADAWEQELDANGRQADIEALVALGRELANPVLVDCTASDAVPRIYAEFMTAGFNIVTPNKRGNSGSMESYRSLKRLAVSRRRRYLYEATVGAGLPVIDNLQKLMLAGDELVSFRGILSGSLSYLFGRLEEGDRFSAIVRDAMDKGFMEPDPRDDLSGADFARKVLILAREAGLSMELSDISLAGLVPPEYVGIDKAEFIARLPELDGRFEAIRAGAAARGQAARFIGSLEGGKGRVGLEAVGPEHPMFSVKGGENALAFSTRYYSPIPLVIRGYGAGAAVTAAGIFGDILRTLNWDKEA